MTVEEETGRGDVKTGTNFDSGMDAWHELMSFYNIKILMILNHLLLCSPGAGCTHDGECERDRACDVEAGTCVDPCKGACGQKSFCNAKEHKPSCFELANTESKFKLVVSNFSWGYSALNFPK